MVFSRRFKPIDNEYKTRRDILLEESATTSATQSAYGARERLARLLRRMRWVASRDIMLCVLCLLKSSSYPW